MAKAIIALKILISVGLLGFLAFKVNAGSLWREVMATSVPYLGLALACAVAQVFIVGYRWHRVIEGLRQGEQPILTRRQVQQANWISQAFSQVLPFIAGDAMRVVLLREQGLSTRVAIESALIDRGLAVGVLFAVAACGVLFSPLFWQTEPYATRLAILIGFGLAASILGLALAPRIKDGLGHIKGLGTISQSLFELRRLVTSRCYGPKLLPIALIVHLISITVFWLVARGNDANLSFADAMVIAPLLLLVTMMPFAVGGWGLREAFLVALLAKAGVALETSLLLAFLFGMVLLIAALPGFLLLAVSAFEVSKNVRTESARSA